MISISTKKFIFYLATFLQPEEEIIVPNDLYCGIRNTSTGAVTPMAMYEVSSVSMTNGIYTIQNAVNSMANGVIVNGNTTVTNTASSVSPTNPNTFTAIRDIMVQSAPSTDLLEDSEFKINYNSPFYLNRLPNGVSDFLILNNGYGFLINTIGRLKITGNEVWEKVNEMSTNTYSVFFLEYDLMKQDDGADVIISTHFPSTTYASLSGGILTPNAISCASASSGKHGIYIMIANTYLAGRELSDFKNFLRNAYRSSNPVVILHQLAKPKIKNIMINDYKLQTFFPYTSYKTNYPSNVALCVNMVYPK